MFDVMPRTSQVHCAMVRGHRGVDSEVSQVKVWAPVVWTFKQPAGNILCAHMVTVVTGSV